MFLLWISGVGASGYYAMVRLHCLNKNILINNSIVRRFIEILAVNEALNLVICKIKVEKLL